LRDVLGSGQRLFEHDDHVTKLRLLSSTATSTGVSLAAYEPLEHLQPSDPGSRRDG
jgi:DNA-binding transcriptional MerR regulator